MFPRFDIVHRTVYRYRTPVTFGEHRVMFRPRDSHDLRVLATDMQVSPKASVRLMQDPHSNSIALVQPLEPALALQIECRFAIEHAQAGAAPLPPLAPSALFLPFSYSVEDRFDLEHYLRPHHEDPQGELSFWARRFIRGGGPTGTLELLVAMNHDIHNTFTYRAREEEGTQPPLVTLHQRNGSCRDFALLMMEAARRLGIATRFVSGYLYDPALDGAAPADGVVPVVGSGGTHAWLQAYLPGAGWVPFDPTNDIVGGSSRLIRVAVARDPAQASALSGSWFGAADAYIGMDVEVSVKRAPGSGHTG